MVNPRAATTLAALVLAGCSWHLPDAPGQDASPDTTPVDDTTTPPTDVLDASSDARDGSDAMDTLDALVDVADSGTDVPPDLTARCPGPADMTAVRVAQLVPDLAAVDLCLAHAETPTAFVGPVLAHSQFLPDGVAYQQLTGYFALQPGAYLVRVVPVGSTGCTTAATGVADATVVVPIQTYSTLAIIGFAGAAPHATTRLYGDTHASLGTANESPRIRVIHAAPDTMQVAVEVSVGGFAMEAGRASFGELGMPPTTGFLMADCNGFFPVPAMTTIPVSIVTPPDASTPTLSFSLSLPFRHLDSAFLTGSMASGTHPLQVLFCDDRTTISGYASCQSYP